MSRVAVVFLVLMIAEALGMAAVGLAMAYERSPRFRGLLERLLPSGDQ